MATGIAEVHEALSDKLPQTRGIQHPIDLVSGISFLNLPHHRMHLTMYIELKRKVDKLSLEIRQQCFVLINIHFYEDKFWSYLVTKNIGMIKDVIIYDRSIRNFLTMQLWENMMPYKLSSSLPLLLNLRVHLLCL